MMSMLFKALSGRERREYGIVDMLTWDIGGLALGVTHDLFDFLADIVQAAAGTDEMKEAAIDRLPRDAHRFGDMFIFGYREILDIFETMTDTTGLDMYYIRRLRGWLDENYTPEELDKIDRTAFEKFQHILAGTNPPDPGVYEQALLDLVDLETRLGTKDDEGRYYTLKQFGGNIATIVKPLPPDMVSEDYGFSELVVFYAECSQRWEPLYNLPSEARDDWREAHITEEAMLLFWGKYSESVFTVGSPQWEEARKLLTIWFDYYNIDKTKHPAFATWEVQGY